MIVGHDGGVRCDEIGKTRLDDLLHLLLKGRCPESNRHCTMDVADGHRVDIVVVARREVQLVDQFEQGGFFHRGVVAIVCILDTDVVWMVYRD